MADRIVLNTISYHGHGAIENIVPELTARGYKKAFVCSDPDLIKFGVTKKVTDLLDAANFAYAVYSEIKPNPTIANVQDGVAAFKAAEADCIVTIGGGSSMDTAKAIGIIINNPEFADVRSLEGVAPTKKHAVFTIAVPTTAGTAAEVTINYVITDVEKKRKFVCVDTNDIPEIAVVDPDMMSSMPKGLTAATGMDALTHAIEGYITKGHCTISDMFHLEAIKLLQLNRSAANGGSDGFHCPLATGNDDSRRVRVRSFDIFCVEGKIQPPLVRNFNSITHGRVVRSKTKQTGKQSLVSPMPFSCAGKAASHINIGFLYLFSPAKAYHPSQTDGPSGVA